MANTVWTREIRLEKITIEQFEAIEAEWREDMPKRFPRTYCRIFNPLIGRSYQQLVHKFLEHPQARRINVRDGRDWRRYRKSGIDGSRDIDHIAELATNDPYQVNYFEMVFHPLVASPQMEQNEACLEFTQREGAIIGYKISLHKANKELFDCKLSEPICANVKGIWLPEY